MCGIVLQNRFHPVFERFQHGLPPAALCPVVKVAILLLIEQQSRSKDYRVLARFNDH